MTKMNPRHRLSFREPRMEVLVEEENGMSPPPYNSATNAAKKASILSTCSEPDLSNNASRKKASARNGEDSYSKVAEDVVNRKLIEEQANRLFDLCEPNGDDCVLLGALPQKLKTLIPPAQQQDLSELDFHLQPNNDNSGGAGSSSSSKVIGRRQFVDGIKPLLARLHVHKTAPLPSPIPVGILSPRSMKRRVVLQRPKLSTSSQHFRSISLESTSSPPIDPFGEEGYSIEVLSATPPSTPASTKSANSKLMIAISGEPLGENRQTEGLAQLSPSELIDGDLGNEGSDYHSRLNKNTNVFFGRHLSQPIFFNAPRSRTVAENGGSSHPPANEDKSGEEYFVYAHSSGTIEKRNHSQFAQVVERSIVSNTDLTLAAAARECAEFRKNACEAALEEEMREIAKKYKGTPDLDLRTPDRIFKVVFVGDSGVGKTCFLHRFAAVKPARAPSYSSSALAFRFCHHRFKPLFNATIGVDFTVKTIRVRDRLVAVQLWDTAGQERFRSITRQYFRKADAVVLMYDVTSEQSYLNVRNWITSVRTGVDTECVMCLVGNKVDLFPNELNRPITHKDGKDLADVGEDLLEGRTVDDQSNNAQFKEFNMIFFETSAYTGLGINDCMRALAFQLQQREEEHLDEALKLDSIMQNSKGSWCCV